MSSAGISTSAGIPDFRSTGLGLYDRFKDSDMPHPTAIFSLNYFLPILPILYYCLRIVSKSKEYKTIYFKTK